MPGLLNILKVGVFSMTIFYKDKHYRDQYNKARFNGATREEARSQAELITLGIYGTIAAVALAVLIFFLIVLYIIIVFVNSPGIGVVELLKTYVGLDIGRTASWLLSLVISFSMLCALYIWFKPKHKILGPVMYVGLCSIVSASMINMENGFGDNVGVKFLIDYAPQETIAKSISKISGGLQAKGDEVTKNTSVSSTSAASTAAKQADELTIENDAVSGEVDDAGVALIDSSNKNLGIDSNVEKKVTDAERVSEIYSPSFDCQAAKLSSEKIVCTNYELATLDNVIAEKYRALRALSQNDPGLKSTQIAWIKSVRLCNDVDCIRTLYTKRLSELELYQVSQ